MDVRGGQERNDCSCCHGQVEKEEEGETRQSEETGEREERMRTAKGDHPMNHLNVYGFIIPLLLFASPC